MYTIKRAAELTGVPAATLRAWERRYDIVEPRRTDAGYRIYDEESLDRIREMAALLADGWSASNAAAEVSRRRSTAGTSAAARPPSPAVPSSAGADTPPPAPTDGPTATARLIEAATSLDPAAVARVLDERFSRTSFELVVDDWLMPALEEVGRAWSEGRISVAGEHLVSHAVLRRLAAAYDAAGSRPGSPSVIIGLPAGVHHELGVFAFAVALRRLGVNTVHLGPDLPSPAWSTALEAHAARHAVLSVPRPEDVPATRELIETLRSSHDDVSVFVGGGRQDDLDVPGVIRLGHAIAPAAAQVAAALT
ncbi:MerR family transcriptional regulator [Janibacter cremeus]|uniref:MerR family transcriptional regulator n=1 Tax=Janibacter cremeus TaxID=1285192 RepID=UPI0023F7BA9A|nr:MerR family transcriptional regulator [Janibacter cremeus]WEV76919.1 MerR family transcriptional regulator [Janibacter cremeus]